MQHVLVDLNDLLDLYEVQRRELFLIRKEKQFSDEEIRRQEYQLDFDEAKIIAPSHG